MTLPTLTLPLQLSGLTITPPDPTTPRGDGDDEYGEEHPGTRRNGTMVSVTTNQLWRRRGIRRQGGQGTVLDLTLRGDGIWNASVLLLSFWLSGSLALWLTPSLLLLLHSSRSHPS